MDFDSQLEAKASELLARHGIVRAESVLPVTFYDANGAPFRAKADFRHEATGVLFELKDSFLNETGTQARARSKRQAWQGSSDRYGQLQCDWNHSAAKLDAVQNGIADAGGALIALFWRQPDPQTVARLNRRGTFWLIYGSQQWGTFTGFLTLAANGLPVTVEFCDERGMPHHQFKNTRQIATCACR